MARRYAEALYRLAREQGRVKEIEAEYRQVFEETGGILDFMRFLAHPLVPAKRKVEVIDRAFPALCPDLRNLLYLLVRNGREDYLGLIFEEFLGVRAKGEGTTRVGVVVARQLKDDERARLSEHLERVLGGRVELEERVDPHLIGGAKITIGEKVLDTSLEEKLERLKALLQG